MTADATPRKTDADRTRADLVGVLRERLGQEKRRYLDATLDVRIAEERWRARPTEDNRLALVDELTVGLCLGRNHLICLDDLARALGPSCASEIEATRTAEAETTAWLGRTGDTLRHLFDPAA
ncbi:hypothetical protein GCM10009836_32150 [Pseudonocardia ailaonensis]|uniref:DUF222 domain-containing protein n=1 Tax=Pseudonocardia ailaonensis TaxID=367279 RepID=A0ABN2N2M6_9PSEU